MNKSSQLTLLLFFYQATLCPGPAMYAAFAGVTPVLYVWMPSFLMGSTLGEHLKPWFAKLKNKKKVN